ncbi:putative two-component response regulator-like APRR6 [Cicer arietinum]|uniref:putative two-component response regulator-like APRR6 n=1 Tax=Cicer arietinum TaxID=3827 RepID=UPI003CC6C200
MEDGSVSLINYVPTFVRRCNVLLIHDSTLSLHCLSKMLEQYSFKVTVTHDISAAASMICNDEYNFKLIMAKANIPGMDTHLEVVLFNKVLYTVGFLNHDDAKWKALERETLCYFIHEPLCSNDLKYVWQHVYHSENYSYKETQNVDSQDKHCDGKTKQSVAMEKKKRKRWSSIEMEEENDARPKQILKYMNEPTMTVRQVASHLQVIN